MGICEVLKLLCAFLQKLLTFFLKTLVVCVVMMRDSLLDKLAAFLDNLLFEASAQCFNVYLVLVFNPFLNILVSQLPVQDPNPNHCHVPCTLKSPQLENLSHLRVYSNHATIKALNLYKLFF